MYVPTREPYSNENFYINKYFIDKNQADNILFEIMFRSIQMAFDLDKTFQLDVAHIHLKDAHTAVFSLYNVKIPFIIWLLENPSSPLALPGKISLRHHDYIHILLGRGISPEDEAFVIGFTMGNDLKTNRLHLFIYKVFAKFIYPYPYNFSKLDLIKFNLGFMYGRKIKVKQINNIDFEIHHNESINYLRNLFGIHADEIQLIREFEIWLTFDYNASKKYYENAPAL